MGRFVETDEALFLDLTDPTKYDDEYWSSLCSTILDPEIILCEVINLCTQIPSRCEHEELYMYIEKTIELCQDPPAIVRVKLH